MCMSLLAGVSTPVLFNGHSKSVKIAIAGAFYDCGTHCMSRV